MQVRRSIDTCNKLTISNRMVQMHPSASCYQYQGLDLRQKYGNALKHQSPKVMSTHRKFYMLRLRIIN